MCLFYSTINFSMSLQMHNNFLYTSSSSHQFIEDSYSKASFSLHVCMHLVCVCVCVCIHVRVGVCVGVCAYLYVPGWASRGKMTTCRSWVSPITWAQGVNFKSSSLAPRTFTHWAFSPAHHFPLNWASQRIWATWKVGDNLCNAKLKPRQEVQSVNKRACGQSKTCQKEKKGETSGVEERWHMHGKEHESLKRI